MQKSLKASIPNIEAQGNWPAQGEFISFIFILQHNLAEPINPKKSFWSFVSLFYRTKKIQIKNKKYNHVRF